MSPASFRLACVHCGAPRCRLVRSGSRGFTPLRLAVVGFIRVLVGLLGRSRCHRVHSGSRGFIRVRLVVMEFIGVGVGSLVR